MRSILHDHFYGCNDKVLTKAWVEVLVELTEKDLKIEKLEKDIIWHRIGRIMQIAFIAYLMYKLSGM